MKITKTFDETTDENITVDKRTLTLIAEEADKSEYNKGFLEIVFGKGNDDE